MSFETFVKDYLAGADRPTARVAGLDIATIEHKRGVAMVMPVASGTRTGCQMLPQRRGVLVHDHSLAPSVRGDK